MYTKSIHDTLIKLGVTPAYKGYAYATTAILKVIEEPGLGTGKVYRHVARVHGASYPQVERAIRHASTVCLNRVNNIPLIETIFGAAFSPDGTIVNSDFIHCIARYVTEVLPNA